MSKREIDEMLEFASFLDEHYVNKLLEYKYVIRKYVILCGGLSIFVTAPNGDKMELSGSEMREEIERFEAGGRK